MIQLDPNGELVTVSKDKNIIIWTKNNNSFKSFQILEGHKEPIYCICKMLDGKFATGSDDASIKLWKPKKSESNSSNNVLNKYISYQTLAKHKGRVRCIILLRNGNLCSGSEDQIIKIWQEIKGYYECIFSTIAHHNAVMCLAELKDGLIISGSKDKTLRVWEPSGKAYMKKEVLRKHNHMINTLVELDGGYVASAGGDGVIIIWKSGTMTD